MAVLTIGRIGFETDLAHPYQITESASGERVMTIRGHIKDTTDLEEAKHLRHQLQSQVRSAQTSGMVPVEYTGDDSINGFYYLESATVDISHRAGSLTNTGFFPYTVRLRHINTNLFSAGITGGILPNDHTITSVDDGPVYFPPRVYNVMMPHSGAVLARVGAEGNMNGFHIVDESTNAYWSVSQTAPSNYLTGAVTLRAAVAGSSTRRLIAGVYPADQLDPADWEIDNTLFRVSVGALAGRIYTEIYGGSAWESSNPFEIVAPNGLVSLVWDHLHVLRNDPEEVVIRLLKPAPLSSRGFISLDISVKRGAFFAHCFFATSFSGTITVRSQATAAASAFSPYGVHVTANDGDGNRSCVGTLSAHSTILSGQWGITKTGSSTELDFFLGIELDGTSALQYNIANDLGEQYIYYLTERVQPLVAGAVPI